MEFCTKLLLLRIYAFIIIGNVGQEGAKCGEVLDIFSKTTKTSYFRVIAATQFSRI